VILLIFDYIFCTISYEILDIHLLAIVEKFSSVSRNYMKREDCRAWTYMSANIVIIFDEKMSVMDVENKRIEY
jgi:hypothetical protein